MPSPPINAWDGHMHIVDTKRFPLSSNANYKPHEASLESALINARELNLPKLVFVQPSPYGTDNACLIDALKAVGSHRGRGVVALDPAQTSPEKLREWHTLGVRGVRLNFKSMGQKPSQQDITQLLQAYADALRPMKTWILQLYVDLAVLVDIEPILPRLGVKVVFDHYGSPPVVNSDPTQLLGWQSLIRMMQSGLAYVKISAPYRLSTDPSYADLEHMTKELLQVRGGKSVVFASDWPHTRYEGVCISLFMENCLKWCDHDQSLSNNLFRDNAKALWDVE